ncbi:hypothetical protein NLU13_8204 [Sarocladium strictum]|uniref:Uncharacterized protein n=1 Tax=Sarocladium strictum TaxID=5046 RepID=A0AA39GB80_SARSR|nr:hypothetical protein NLU13_8204 [Sarocladium strictum]
MNAHALLTSQGWRGHGHSLHKSDDKIGLAKPLLLNRKSNTFGISEKNHFTSDQWWMNAFDEQLKGLETTKDGVRQTVTTGKLNAIEKGSLGKYSLYTSFVRGGLLEGTLKGLEEDSTTETTSEAEEVVEKKETKEERRARKEAKRLRKEQRASRRAARAAKRAAKASKEPSSSEDKKLKKQKDRAERDPSSENDKSQEKKIRRAKKEERRRKRALEGSA